MIKKTYVGVAILLAGFAFSFQSCKRGDNDPGLSLKSRTARLKGDWKLTDKSVTLSEATNVGSNTISSKTTTGNYAGGQETVLINDVTGSNPVTTILRKYDFDITFDESGTYEYTFNVYRPTGNTVQPYINYVYVNTGVWTWLDQGKDKLGLSLSSDFAPQIPDSLNPKTLFPYMTDGSYYVDRLASSELVIKRSGQLTTTVDTLVTNNIYEGTFTFGR